jgi:hypothetical protein
MQLDDPNPSFAQEMQSVDQEIDVNATPTQENKKKNGKTALGMRTNTIDFAGLACSWPGRLYPANVFPVAPPRPSSSVTPKNYSVNRSHFPSNLSDDRRGRISNGGSSLSLESREGVLM